VNQTRPHCVNKLGKTHSKPLAARHGRGTAWERHAVCESAFMHHICTLYSHELSGYASLCCDVLQFRECPSSVTVRSVDWQFATDLSDQHIGPIFKDQIIQKDTKRLVFCNTALQKNMTNNCSSPSRHPSRPNTKHEDRGSLYLAKCQWPWLRIYGVINQKTTNWITLP